MYIQTNVSKKSMQIEPPLFADVKAFMGDTSDGYPGVKGIGPKTALKLIQTYSSVEGVLAALEELKPSQRTKIKENEDMLKLSLQLAKINTEIPIDATIDDCKLPIWDQSKLQQLTIEGYPLISRHARSLSNVLVPL